MKRSLKRILPILLVLAILISIGWYLLVYDRSFTMDLMLDSARFFDARGQYTVASWFYDLAYRYSHNDAKVAITLADQFKKEGNYTQAERTLSNAIADGGSVELYVALCKTYVEQDKLLDAVMMLDQVFDPAIKAQLNAMRPATPVPSVEQGNYSQYLDVQLNCDNGTVYAATGNRYPTTKTAPHTEPIKLASGENIITALAVGENGLVSQPVTLKYVVSGVIEDIALADPVIDQAVRQLLNKQASVVLSSADLWTITTFEMPAGATNYADLHYLSYLENLTIDNGSFTNLSDLSALVHLRQLTVSNCVLSSADLAVIAALPELRELTLDNCRLSNISNLSAAQNLVILKLDNNTIRDLSALSGMTRLEALSLNNNAVTDLTQLASLSNLKELDVSYNALTSVAPLASCTSLWAVDISNNNIASLYGLDTLTNLSVLKADYNKLTDISSLSHTTALTKLDLSHNTISSLAPLSGLMNLETLLFDYNIVMELPKWDENCNLAIIQGSHNYISSVEPLSGLNKLSAVILEYNNLTNVDSLTTCNALIQVNIFGNAVTDVSALIALGIEVNYSPM